ncbi:MAG: long-chain fatty acid--CoA ligase, partial [Mariprofundaceae bacterium]|nr:long-chain fatty acid--CoA ligase [Mariprofundaceae bacterium]
DEYLPVTYEQLDARIRAVAAGLLRAGVKPGERVALLMENRPEWAVVDYAILSIGAVTVPMYCTYRPQDVAYVLNDASAKICITSGGNLLRHLLLAAEDASGLKAMYAIDCGSNKHKRLHDFAELQTEMDEAAQKAVDKRLAAVSRDTLATLIYTSGTTGDPKGVMLTHGNIMANLEVVPSVIKLGDGDVMLSFLPLAHALERTGSHFLAYSFGLSVAFAERPDTVAKNLTEARPTLMVTVPRLLEVIRSRMLGQVAKQGGLSRFMFGQFLSLGMLARQGKLSALQAMRHRLLDRIVGRRIRERFGGRLQVLISGGAPLSVEVAGFFEALGLPVIEGYGMTEAAPLISVNPMHDRRIGSVGLPAHNEEVRIAEDGEIVVRGANVMSGYWKRRKDSAETIVDGWLHTGDIGHLDDGYLYITDRKKDLIVNSGGENIAPQRIEGLLIGDIMIDQAVVYGDKKPYLVALIIPNEEDCRAWAEEQGLPETDWAHLCAAKLVRKHLQTRIADILKPINAFEQVRRIYVLETPLSMDEGLLTPTMKVRRRQVFERYGELLEGLYR